MCCRFVVAAIVVSAVLPAGSGLAQSTSRTELAEAERLFDALQFEAAMGLLTELIDGSDGLGVDAADLLGRCYELRGRAAFNLGRMQIAESDFASWLETDPSVRLPADASPRLFELFDAVRARTIGTLFVTMEPPGRLVIAGRAFILETPNEVVDVLAGSHTIVAARLGHREERRDVVIGAGQVYELDIRLERVSGSVRVATDPPGARVSVDGQYIGETAPGRTPGEPSLPVVAADLMPGQHRLQIDRPCSAPRSVPFNIPDPPVDADVGVVDLEPAVATAVIETPTAGALVYVDGVLRGRAPTQLGDICEGAREIEVRAQRRRFVDRRVWRAGDTVTLRADFRWSFMLLPSGPAAGSDDPLLSQVEEVLQDSQRVLIMTPTPAELGVMAAMDGPLSVVRDDLRSIDERRAAGERLTDVLGTQGVAWVTQAAGGPADTFSLAGGPADTFSLSVLARGSGVADTLMVRLTDLGSRAAAIRSLSAAVPTITHPSLDASFVDVADVEGAAVVRVPTGVAGESAGLTAGDVIAAVNGVPVTSVGGLDRLLAAHGVGSELMLLVREPEGERRVDVRITETPEVVPLTDASSLPNLLLPDVEDAVATAMTFLAESAARLNSAVVHIRLQNWDRALRELAQVALPDGPGVSAGTVSYLTALCLLEVSQLTAAEAALRRAVAAEESVLFAGGPRVSPLAQRRLDEFMGSRR